VPTRVAFTQIRSAINGLVRDTPELTKAFEEYGGAQKVIAEQGLAKALQIARDAADGNVGVLNKLVGSIEGVGAVLGLTGPQLEEFVEQIQAQNEASGDAQEAADKVADSFGEQLRVAIQRVSNAFEQLGQVAVPIVQPIVEAVGNLALAFSNLLQRNPAARFFAGIVAVTGVLLTALGTLITSLALVGRGFVFVKTSAALAGLNLAKFTTATGLATVATRGLTLAIRTLLGPVGLILAAITGIILVFDDYQDTVKDVGERTDELKEKNDELAESFDNLDEAGQATALRDQRQLVRDLKRDLEELNRQRESASRRRGGSRRNAELLADIRNTEEALASAEAQLADFEEKFTAINDAALTLDAQGIQRLEDGVQDTKDRIDELIADTEQYRDVIRTVGDVEEDNTARGRGAAEARRRQREEAERQLAVANETVQANAAEVFALRAALAIQERRLARAKEIKAEVDARAKAEEDAKAALEANLALAESALALEKRRTQELNARQRAEARVFRAQQRLEEARDRRALEAGERGEEGGIDQEEFDRRARERVDAQLAATRKALGEKLEQAKAETEAKIAELEAEELADLEGKTDNTAAIADARAKLNAVEIAVAGELREAEINAIIAGEAIGADLAEAIADGFESRTGAIGDALRTELARLQGELDAGLISQEVFAQGVARSTQTARDAYAALRAEIEAAISGADPAQAEILKGQLRDIDIALANLGKSVSIFEQQLKTAVEGELATFFETILTDIDDVNDAFTQLFINIGEQVKKLIAQKLAEKLTSSLFGEGSVLGGFLGGSSGGSVPGASTGGYVQAAKGGYMPAGASQFVRMASGGYAGGVMAGHLLKTAQGRTGSLRAPRQIRYKAATGGGILKLQEGGGRVRGKGTATSDHVPAMLSNGEYVMRAAAVDKYGLNIMEAINRGLIRNRDVRDAAPKRRLTITKPARQKFAEGGLVVSAPTVAGAPNQGIQNAAQASGGAMKLEVNEATLNLTMRDFLEREFGRILATR
jgi:hypothetical protein